MLGLQLNHFITIYLIILINNCERCLSKFPKVTSSNLLLWSHKHNDPSFTLLQVLDATAVVVWRSCKEYRRIIIVKTLDLKVLIKQTDYFQSASFSSLRHCWVFYSIIMHFTT